MRIPECSRLVGTSGRIKRLHMIPILVNEFPSGSRRHRAMSLPVDLACAKVDTSFAFSTTE